jgi:hypothetical protein
MDRETLKGLVSEEVRAFTEDERSFTAYDITKKIRERVGDTVHKDVRNTVVELWENNELYPYVRVKSAEGFFTYVPEKAVDGFLPAPAKSEEISDGLPRLLEDLHQLGHTSLETRDYETKAAVQHTFVLRKGYRVSITLPEDLTIREASRLALFVQSLPFDNEDGY